MSRKNSKFYVYNLNTFSFPVNGISTLEKENKIEFGVVSTYTVKIWDNLNENCSSKVSETLWICNKSEWNVWHIFLISPIND